MSKTILTNIDGWTPIIDSLVNEFNVTTALIFGRVWRYCQMEDGACWAAQSTIADYFDMSRDTVSRALKSLVNAGYLEETQTPGKTNFYTDTGKAGLFINISATPPAKSDNTPRKIRQVPTAKSDIKIVLKKEYKREYSPEKSQVNDPTYAECNDDGIEVTSKKKRDKTIPVLKNQYVSYFRTITGFKKLNVIQIKLIEDNITDQTRWDDCIRHWLGHGYYVGNVAGIVESYKKGGRSACTNCNPKNNGEVRQPKTLEDNGYKQVIVPEGFGE